MNALPLKPEQVPSKAEMVALMDIKEPLLLALRGHQALDKLLNTVLNSALPAPHEVEVEQLSFLLKVDLAIALTMLPQGYRGTFTAINRVRNQFAHDPNAVLDEQIAAEIRATYSPTQREKLGKLIEEHTAPLDTLILLVGVLFQCLRSTLQQTLDRAIEEQATMEILREALDIYKARNPGDAHLKPVRKDIEERIAQKRADVYKG